MCTHNKRKYQKSHIQDLAWPLWFFVIVDKIQVIPRCEYEAKESCQSPLIMSSYRRSVNILRINSEKKIHEVDVVTEMLHVPYGHDVYLDMYIHMRMNIEPSWKLRMERSFGKINGVWLSCI